jgi:hypothetical protein
MLKIDRGLLSPIARYAYALTCQPKTTHTFLASPLNLMSIRTALHNSNLPVSQMSGGRA